MKFKNIVLSLALMSSLLVSSKLYAEVCFNPVLDAFGINVDQFVNQIRGVKCFNGKDIKTDYESVCGCVDSYAGMMPKNMVGMAIFNQRKTSILETNRTAVEIAEMERVIQSEEDRDKELNIKKMKRKWARIEKDLSNKNKSTQEIIGIPETTSDERESARKCGYHPDEFLRFSRVPKYDLFVAAVGGEDVSEGELTTSWDEYITSNPDLLSVYENLSDDQPSQKVEFRKEVLDRLSSIKKHAPPGQRLYDNLEISSGINNTTLKFNNSKPEKNLWKLIDDDFESGNLKEILARYSKISLPRHKKSLSAATNALDPNEGDFKPHFKNLLNPEMWDLYFGEKSSAETGCGLDKVTKKTATETLTCLQNISGFCALYKATKDDVASYDPKLLRGVDLKPLMNIEAATNKSNKIHRTQIQLICQTPMKVSFLLDKKGNEINEKMTVEQFRLRLCDEKDIKIVDMRKPKISDHDISVACKAPLYSKIQGFYQRLIKSSDFDEASEPLLKNMSPEEIDSLRLSDMRSFLKEKSKFNMPTKNTRDNIIEALSGGSGSFAKILSERQAADKVYFQELNNMFTANENQTVANNIAPTPQKTNTAPVVTAPNINNETVTTPVSSGYTSVPTTVTSEAKRQQDVMAEETKRMVETKEKIANLVEQKENLPPSSPDNSVFEKQIQDLKDQLAQSEARYQSAFESFKKSNSVASSVEDKQISNQPFQRNLPSPTTTNSEYNTNSTGSSGASSNRTPASVFGAGKMVGSDPNSSAAKTNNALLQANSNEGSSSKGRYDVKNGLSIQIVKDEKENIDVGIVSDRSAYDLLKKKDQKIYSRYLEEMLSKRITTLIVKDGENVLRYKLVELDEGYELREETGVSPASVQKYFIKHLTNALKSTVQVSQ